MNDYKKEEESYIEIMLKPYDYPLVTADRARELNIKMDEMLSNKVFADVTASLAIARFKGRFGWWLKSLVSNEELKDRLMSAILIEDWQTVINYAAMLSARSTL